MLVEPICSSCLAENGGLKRPFVQCYCSINSRSKLQCFQQAFNRSGLSCTDPFTMNFKRFGITALQVVGLGLMPSAALADITDTTTFTGAVPGTCTLVSGGTQTVNLTYSSANSGTLAGESANMTYNCNFETKFTLGQVNQVAVATSTTDTATLKASNGSTITTSTNSAASSATDFANPLNTNFTVTIGLTSTGASVVGDYTYTVVLTTLSA